MARTVSEGIREGLLTMSALQGQRDQRKQQELQNQLAMAELQTKGYQFTPGTEGFMGIGAKPFQLTQTPGYTDWDKFSKQLSAMKTLKDLEPGSPEDWIEHPTLKGLAYNKRTGETKKLGADTQISFGDFI